MLKFADIFSKGPNFNPMQFIRKSSYILTPKTSLIGRLGGPEARMSTVGNIEILLLGKFFPQVFVPKVKYLCMMRFYVSCYDKTEPQFIVQ